MDDGALFSSDLTELAAQLLAACRSRTIMLATAESCTGGLIAGLLTDIPGSSDVVERGFVTYSNAAKQSMLGVPADVLARYGAVSEQTARAMATGLLRHAPSGVGLAFAVTGIAGPGGGSVDKPVGLVYTAAAFRQARRQDRGQDMGAGAEPSTITVLRHAFGGNRAAIRIAAVRATILQGLAILEKAG